MRRRLPPLNSLRAFESAARQLSFTRAADELAVTQSAVSHQVAALEEWAGVPLFKRQGRQMALTEAAARYLPTVSAAFDQIALASRKLQAVDPTHGWLTVAVMPSFAGKWLVPRLADFHEKNPDMDVWIARTPDNAQRVVDALREFGFDCPIKLLMKENEVVRMGVPPFRLEILTTISGVNFSSNEMPTSAITFLCVKLLIRRPSLRKSRLPLIPTAEIRFEYISFLKNYQHDQDYLYD